MEEKLKNHEVVKALSEIAKDAPGSKPVLIGGAVIDIVEGREPKDYDIIVYGNQKDFVQALEKCGYRLLMDSNTATTYFFKDIKVQLLKTNVIDFDFTVSQSSVDLSDMTMDLKKHEIENKLLIPISFNDKKAILNSLSRLPHWIRKGYHIKDETYYTLLNKLRKVKSQETKEVSYPYGS